MINTSIAAVWGKKLHTVYCIIYDEYIYIGITEDYPFHRWSHHFSSNGSFVKAIKKQIEEFEYKKEKIKILSLTFEYNYIKNDKMLLAIEKALHDNFDRNPFIDGMGFSVISSTTKTAPRAYDYKSLISDIHIIRKKINCLYKQAL